MWEKAGCIMGIVKVANKRLSHKLIISYFLYEHYEQLLHKSPRFLRKSCLKRGNKKKDGKVISGNHSQLNC